MSFNQNFRMPLNYYPNGPLSATGPTADLDLDEMETDYIHGKITSIT